MATLDTSRIYIITNEYAEDGEVLAVSASGSALEMRTGGPVSGPGASPSSPSSSSSSSTQWFLTPTDMPHFYRLHALALGEARSLDVVNDNGVASVGVQMAATGNYSGQFWRFDQWPDHAAGTYRLSNNFTGPGKYLDVHDDTLHLHLSLTRSAGQRWTLNPAPAVFSVAPPSAMVAAQGSNSAAAVPAVASVSTTTSVTVPAATSVTVSTTTSTSGVTVEFTWR
ncbi:hypothetical protein F4802DRAFT_217573 [Xylaria palmicola]|nr:hypothetical protein F4802DRAFT_217573 [Xylaria palmicola]